MKDKIKLLFGTLNLLQGALIGAIVLLVPSREPLVNGVLIGAAVAMLVAGPLLVFAGKWGRRIVLGICLAYWLLGLAGIGLIVSAAAYLLGIYGHHGQSAGAMAFVLALLVAVVFWLLPAHEIHYLKKTGRAQ